VCRRPFRRYRAVRPRPPHGVTLLELLLVLAVLAAAAALAWPALQRPLADQRLRKAADLIRAQWVTARVEAMESGETILFRCTPGGNRYSLQLAALALADPQAADAQTALAGPAQGETLAADDFNPQTGLLPEGVSFVGAEQIVLAGQSGLQPGASQACTDLLFQPDGTTTDSRLVLCNQDGSTIELTLRGLTGVVTVGPVVVSGGQVP